MQYAIHKAEINDKPLLEYTGPVSLVRADAELPAALDALRGQVLLGFDTETRPAFRKGERYLPSLLQLAAPNRVWLFQIQRLRDLGPLFDVLADTEIRKVGAATQRDLLELQELHPFKPGNFQDIGHMADQRGFHQTGLRALAALLLDGRISKGAQVSNWAAEELNERQITYAATDAWVSLRIYEALKDLPKREKEMPVPVEGKP
jgi:ribonuclease D